MRTLYARTWWLLSSKAIYVRIKKKVKRFVSQVLERASDEVEVADGDILEGSSLSDSDKQGQECCLRLPTSFRGSDDARAKC